MTELSPLRVFRLLALLGCSLTLPFAALRGAEETAAPATPPPAAHAAETTPATAPEKAASAPAAAAADTTPSAVAPETPAPAPSAPIAPIPPLEKPASTSTPTPPPSPSSDEVEAAEKAIKWKDRHDVVQFVGDVTVRSDERAHDVVVFGGDAKIDGQVVHDLVVFGGDITLNGRVRGSVVVFGGDIELGPKANLGHELVVFGGELSNPHGRPVPRQEIFGGVSFGKLDNPAVHWVQRGFFKGRLLVPGIAWPWMVFGAFTLFYLLIAALFPRGVAACVESIEERPGGTLLASFLMLFVLPLMVLLLVVTVVGNLLIPFLLIGVFFAGIFGKASLATFLGRSLLRSFGLTEPASRIVIALLVGVVLLAVLYLIPVLGVLTWAITAWYGLGVALFTAAKRMRREKPATPRASATRAVPAAAPRRPMASADLGARTAGFAPAAPVPEATSETPASGAAVAIAPATMDPASAAGFEAATPPGTSDVGAAPGVTSAGFVGSASNAGAATPGATAVPPSGSPGYAGVPPVLPQAAWSAVANVNSTSPRAEFWPRLGAFVIDVALIFFVSLVISLELFPFFFGAYSYAMWFWRGTTIGGVVFSLKIVRLDDRPVDPATVLVRVLVGYVSLFMAGLGFLWCLWDPEQQTWHDKVAGTIVVRAPKGMSLV